MNMRAFFLAALTAANSQCGYAGENRSFLRERPPTQHEQLVHDANRLQLEDEEISLTQSLMNSLSTRRLEEDEVCMPFKSSCDDTSPCCQGGCTTANTCHCQQNDGLCFNIGEEDNFCCSNKCGMNGRCECIEEDESCAVGDGFCCDGLTCRDGKCVNGGSNDMADLIFHEPNSNIRNSDPLNEDTDNSIPSSKPTKRRRRPSKLPTVSPTQKAESFEVFTSETSYNGCGSGEVKVTVEIKTDKWGGDTSWFIAGIDSVNKKIINVKNNTYAAKSTNSVDACLSKGDYNFTVYDEYGDGLCCAYGDGHVRVLLDDREVLFAKFFKKMLTQVIKVGYDATVGMTERDTLYLKAHNYRRKQWHESNNVSYVPLVWSHQLAFQSRIWAEKLLVNCSKAGIEHEPGVADGENLAKNVGKNDTWGQLYPPTNIVGRWVDWEVKRPYPGNAHLTQALWRPSKYMGCGESVKDFRNGKCRVQVCRYSRAGNCDMGRYNATFAKNWLPPMIASTSRCGPDCAPEGCY